MTSPASPPVLEPEITSACPWFGGVNNVIAGDGVDGQHRHGEIHRQPVSGGRRVTRFIAYRGANGVLAGGQIAEICRRHTDAPAAVRLDGASVSHTIKRDGYRLPRFGGTAAADG